MDHLELPVLVAASAFASIPNFARTPSIATIASKENEVTDKLPSLISPHPPSPVTLHYDMRVRGGTLETDVDLTRTRIQSVWSTLQDIRNDNNRLNQCNLDGVLEEDDISTDAVRVGSQLVKASFLLSSDAPNDKDGDTNELELSSTIGRELGFAVHHAIHHMAMVKIIAVKTIGLDAKDIPPDFGRAPSTIQHDNDEIGLRNHAGSNNLNG